MHLMSLKFKDFIPNNSSIDNLQLKIVDYSDCKDVQAKFKFHKEVFNPSFDLKGHIESLRISFSSGNGFGLFLYDNDILVGTLDFERTNDYAYILNYGLLEDYRGNGLGRKFLELSLNKIVKEYGNKYSEVYLLVSKSNNVALELYKSLGFRIEN